MIRLEDGATTFISSLEEYLAKTATTTTTSSSTSDGGEREQTLVTANSASLLSGGSNEEQRAHLHHQQTPPESYQEAKTPTPTSTYTYTSSSSDHHTNHHHHHHEATNQTNKPIPQHYQVKSLLNVTHDYPLAYSQVICGYVWPLMAALTLFTNLMIVFILTQRDMRTPTNVVLTAIAIADIIPIVVPVPWFVYLFAMGNEKQVLYPPVACYFYQHSTRSVSEIFYFLSTWLNVLLAIQDYLTACRPNLAKKYCQIKVVIIEIVCLTFLAFLLNLPQALKIVFKPVKFYYHGQLTWGCKALQARWFKDLVGEYVALYDDIFTAIIVLFVDGGPAIVLITLTALLIRQLQRQRIKGHLLMEQARTASKRRRERHRQQEYESSARVMIFVLLAFLAVKIPFATTYTLMIIQSRFNIRFVDNLVDFQKAITLTDLVFVLSYPINFTIFCCCSKKFRHKCAQLLSECNDNTRTTKDRLWSSFSEQSALNSLTDSQSMVSQRNAKPPGGLRNDSLATISSRQEFLDMLASKRESLGSILSGPGAANRTNGPLARHQNEMVTSNHSRIDHIEDNNSVVCVGNNSEVDHHDCARYDHQQTERNKALASVNFKALLEDGNLCLECILRYEQLRKKSVANQHSTLNETQNTNNTTNVSQSTDSSSWTATCQQHQHQHHRVPPPPPAPLSAAYLQRQQLPSIITTWCESIRENSSTDEMNGSGSQLMTTNEESSGQGQPEEEEEQRQQQQKQQQPPPLQSDSMEETSTRDSCDAGMAERYKWDAKLLAGSIGRSANSVDGAATAAAVVSVATGRDNSLGRRRVDDSHLVRPRWNGKLRNSSDPGPGASERLMGATQQGHHRPNDTDTTTMNSGSSRRASTSNEAMEMSPGGQSGHKCKSSRKADKKRSKNNKGHQKESKGSGSGSGVKKRPKELTLSLIESRQRSLSLSNSNLSTLPNATGMLADMFVSALMGASGGSQQDSTSADGGGGGGGGGSQKSSNAKKR